ncbi:hypothetical protein [Hutsoniella sourekii]|uniref:hypothetical protein n=1 Tax=Hutsoniella sourekii TaxID=87650 RepID=UPI0004819A3E|nr:hypothetical protein [Hutsoniella sourekii]
MRSIKASVLLLASITLLGACSSQSNNRPTVGGDPILLESGEYESLTSERMEYAELSNQVSKQLEEIADIQMEIREEFTLNDQTYTRIQSNQEKYVDSKDQRILGQYLINQTNQAGDSSSQENFYYKGDENYHQMNQGSWVKRENSSRTPINYFSIVRLLVEDANTWQVEVDESGVSDVRKQVQDSQIIQSLPYLLDLPVALSPKAQVDLSIDYQINTESGLIQEAVITGNIEDLGQSSSFKVTGQVTDGESSVEVDTNAEPEALDVAPSSDGFNEAFLEANPTSALTYGETYVYHIKGESDQAESQQVQLGNYWMDQLHLAVWGQVDSDGNMDQVSLEKDGQLIKQEDQSVTETHSIAYYPQFVNRFVEFRSSLEEIETSSDRHNEQEHYIFREEMKNGLKGLQTLAGSLDLSHLDRPEAKYFVDYYINKKTLKLESVYLSSITPEDQAINYLTAFNFSQFNEANPSSMTGFIEATTWQTLDQE